MCYLCLKANSAHFLHLQGTQEDAKEEIHQQSKLNRREIIINIPDIQDIVIRIQEPENIIEKLNYFEITLIFIFCLYLLYCLFNCKDNFNIKDFDLGRVLRFKTAEYV